MKAQSAFEYLMTYGWAILIVIIVTAALYAIGIFNIETYTKDSSFCEWFPEAKDCRNWTSPITTNCPIYIPNSTFVAAFCDSKGYAGGWLDSQGCGENQVRCYRIIGTAHYYDCLDVRAV